MLILVMLMFEKLYRRFKSVFSLDRFKERFSVKKRNGGRNDNSRRVFLSHKLHRRFELFGRNDIGVAHYYGACVFDLIVEKLTEVLHIHFALTGVDNGRERIKSYFIAADVLDRTDDIGELADTGRLDNNSVGCKLCKDFFKRLAEIAYKAATDTAGIHFGYFDAGVFEKSAVDTYFTELVFDEYEFFALVAVGNELFDKRSFACAEKTRENIYFCHGLTTSF